MNLSDIFDVYEANKHRLHQNVVARQHLSEQDSNRKPLGEIDLNR